MDKIKLPDNKEYIVYEKFSEIDHYEKQKRMAVLSAWDLMDNCIDTIYLNMVNVCPNVYKPNIYIIECDIPNAFAYKSNIYVTIGLIYEAIKLIYLRYTEDLLNRYNILNGVDVDNVKSGIRVYFWRFVVLHELYHLWHKHIVWENAYMLYEDKCFIEEKEHNPYFNMTATDKEKEDNIKLQVLEYDADISAMCALINLLMYDVESKEIEDKKAYIKQHLAEMMAAISTMFCLFDGNYGAKFSKLNSLCKNKHPIPSIRLFYLEETANNMLWQYFDKEDEIFYLESEWQKMVCDVEADFEGEVEIGQVFYHTAYTTKAQEHLQLIKEKFNEIHDTLSPMCLSGICEKFDEEFIKYDPLSVWFTDTGESIYNWKKPRT